MTAEPQGKLTLNFDPEEVAKFLSTLTPLNGKPLEFREYHPPFLED